jgi:hypothetical protein
MNRARHFIGTPERFRGYERIAQELGRPENPTG